MKRIDTVDVFRGIALLQMIFWQILDFFSRANIYTDAPYYFQPFNMPINGIGVGFFAFVVGVGIYLSTTKRNKIEALKHGFKKYFGYILISLVFTTFVFGFPIFFGWEEVIQGIGLSGLIGFVLFLFVRSKKVLGVLAIIFILFQPFILNLSYQYPQEGIVGFLVNMSSRGYFSILNILPLILIGIIIGEYFVKKKPFKLLLILGAVLIFFSLVSHLIGFQINYYNRSTMYSVFYLGISILLLGLLGTILRKKENFILFRPLKTLGRGAFLGYLIHFLIIYKASVVFGFNSVFDFYPSLVFSIISVVIIYFIIKFWLHLKEKRGWKILWI